MARVRPSCLRRLVERLVPEQHREGLLGDLAEECVLRSRSEPASHVARWYRRQVLRSIAPLFSAALKRSHWPATLRIGLGAYLVLGLLELAATWALDGLIAAGARVTLLLSLVVGVAIAALVAYEAARIRRGSAAMLAVIMILVVAALMATGGESTPLWYQIGYLVSGPSAALAGEVLGAKSASRR